MENHLNSGSLDSFSQSTTREADSHSHSEYYNDEEENFGKYMSVELFSIRMDQGYI